MTDGPLIVQSDHTLLLEIDHPQAQECRREIAVFAELERSPEHVHTYRLTKLGLWNARAAGHDAEAIVDTLTAKLFAAARRTHVRAVYLAGGVAANGGLRDRVAAEAERRGLHFRPPERVYCTDNAAMIAYAGYCHFLAGKRDSLALDSFPRGPVTSWR